jgi:hypothetical protein
MMYIPTDNYSKGEPSLEKRVATLEADNKKMIKVCTNLLIMSAFNRLNIEALERKVNDGTDKSDTL